MILKLGNDQYIEWIESEKKPRTSVLSQSEMKNYLYHYLSEKHGLDELPKNEKDLVNQIIKLKIKSIFKRVEANGSTCLEGRDCEEIIKQNKASKTNKHLSLKKIIEIYSYNPDKNDFPFKN